MRAEVGLLTRNIKIKGDANSSNINFGAHIMMTTSSMSLDAQNEKITFKGDITSSIDAYKTSYIRMSNVEISKAGQNLIGRNPIYFNKFGNASGSYVKDCSIHHSYNRAIALKDTIYANIENNITFSIIGHAFYLENSTEIFNTFKSNLGISTKSTTYLTQTDITPATFYITNPLNYFEGNVATGSDSIGIWIKLTNDSSLPRNVSHLPIGSFKNNVAHSNIQDGLRIFELNPQNKINNITNAIDGGVFYRNGSKGLVAEMTGDVVFQYISTADNLVSGIEIASTYYLGKLTTSLVIGVSKVMAPYDITQNGSLNIRGIVTPRMDNFEIDRIYLFNFDKTNIYAFGDCGGCTNTGSSADSGGRSIKMRNIGYDITATNRIKWSTHRNAIFLDIDGTFSGGPIPSVSPSPTPTPLKYVTPYLSYMDSITECVIISFLGDCSVCTNNGNLKVQRVVFYKPIKVGTMSLINMADNNLYDSTFSSMPIRIAKYSDSLLGKTYVE